MNTTTALLCLTLNIYNESRGESIRGQRAVAEVTIRRKNDTRWKDTICGVVYEPYQFSWTLQNFNLKDSLGLDQASVIAADVYYSRVPRATYCADHYYNYNIVNPKWAKDMRVEVVIGNHVFLCSGDK